MRAKGDNVMQIVLIGIGCIIMAIVLFATDPLDFRPDPALQGIVWAGCCCCSRAPRPS
jgi:hypothetical protein